MIVRAMHLASRPAMLDRSTGKYNHGRIVTMVTTYDLSDLPMTVEQADAHVQLGGEVVGMDDGRILVQYGHFISPNARLWPDAEWRAVIGYTTEEAS